MQENHNMWGKPMRAAGTGTALFLQARLAPHIYECAYLLNSAVRENGIYLAGARMLNVKCEMQN